MHSRSKGCLVSFILLLQLAGAARIRKTKRSKDNGKGESVEDQPAVQPKTKHGDSKKDVGSNSTSLSMFQRVKSLPPYGELPDSLEVHSGFVAVPAGKKTAGELFFVFVRQSDPGPEQPLFVWFNGGPGCSSLGGMLMGVGPLFLDRCWQDKWCEDNAHCKNVVEGCESKLVDNPHSWHQHANLLFIETPPGVGFSELDGTNFVKMKKTMGATQFSQVSQSKLGKFHAGLVGTLVSELEGKIGERFGSLLLGGESFAGIYVSSMIPPLLADPILADRFQGVLLGNPKLGSRDRFDATPAALVNRCIIDKSAFDEFQSACSNGDFASQIDLAAKNPDACTKSWVHMYDSVAARRTSGANVNWYNAEVECEMCGSKRDPVPCSPACFDTRPYERLMRVELALRGLGLTGEHERKTPWKFCSEVNKLVADVPMVANPEFTLDPASFLAPLGKNDSFKFWLFSGDSDLESLHEVSFLAMTRMYGSPTVQNAWGSSDGGSEYGDFLSFEKSAGAKLIRVSGGGHLVPYYTTAAAADLFARFVADAPAAGSDVEFSFNPPTLLNPKEHATQVTALDGLIHPGTDVKCGGN